MFVYFSERFSNPFLWFQRQLKASCLIGSLIRFSGLRRDPHSCRVTQGQVMISHPIFLLKPSSLSSKRIPPICIFLSLPAGFFDVINKHKTIKLASNYTFPIYWSVFVRLRNIMILSDKLKQLLSKSLFMMLHIFIWKGKQENKARGGGKPATLLFLPDDPVAVLRERRGRSNVEPLFATALINSGRYLRAHKRLCYFRMEVEQWWWRRRRGGGQQGGEEEVKEGWQRL